MANALVSFIMLGMIPGTTVQITFRDWVLATLIGGFTFVLIVRLRPLIGEVVARIRHPQTDTAVTA